jgi:hypothetical protein
MSNSTRILTSLALANTALMAGMVYYSTTTTKREAPMQLPPARCSKTDFDDIDIDLAFYHSMDRNGLLFDLVTCEKRCNAKK